MKTMFKLPAGETLIAIQEFREEILVATTMGVYRLRGGELHAIPFHQSEGELVPEDIPQGQSNDHDHG